MKESRLVVRLLLVSLLALVGWLALCGWITQRDFDRALGEVIGKRLERSEQEADVTVHHISRSLAYLRGLPVMFGQVRRAEQALLRYGARASAALADADARRSHWPRDPALEELNGFLDHSARALQVDLIFVLNEAGDCIAASNVGTPENLVGTNYADREYFRQAQQGQLGRQYAVGRTTGIPGLFYSAPVVLDGRFRGVVVVKMNTPNLSYWMEQAHVFLVDELGVVIMARDRRIEFHALPDAPVRGKSDAERMARYKTAVLPTLAIAPWGDPRYPDLVRMPGERFPVAMVSRPLSSDPLRVFALHPIPEVADLEANRVYDLVVLAVVGILAITLLAGAYYYLAQRRRAMEMLQASELRFRDLFENSPVAYQSLDDQWRYLDVNDRLCSMLGYTREELIGRPFAELLAPETRNCLANMSARFLAEGAFRGDVVLLREDGERVFVLLEGRIQRDAAERFVRSHCVLYDISERKRSEEALEEANATLAKRVEEETLKSLQRERLLIEQARHAAMGEMIGNIAHQWRQPLSTLGLVVQNLRYDFKAGNLGEAMLDSYVAKALRAIEQMSSTIDDFRDFFKPSRQPEKFSPVVAIHDCVELLGASLKTYNIVLEVSGPADLEIFGYRSEFSHTILNLISNAKDALVDRRVAQGRIGIVVAADARGVTIKVEDNAGGIAPEHLGKIFDPYFTTKDKGTGIGLYMTRTIVEQHMDGSIRAENTAEGARFTIDLPRHLIIDGKPS